MICHLSTANHHNCRSSPIFVLPIAAAPGALDRCSGWETIGVRTKQRWENYLCHFCFQFYMKWSRVKWIGISVSVPSGGYFWTWSRYSINSMNLLVACKPVYINRFINNWWCLTLRNGKRKQWYIFPTLLLATCATVPTVIRAAIPSDPTSAPTLPLATGLPPAESRFF